MSESPRDMLSRVELMARDKGDTWDLSPNDMAALRYVLESREKLLELCKLAVVRTSVDLLGGDYDQTAHIGRDVYEEMKAIARAESEAGA